MEIKEKIIIDSLTAESAAVLKQQFISVDGVDIKLGENIRNAYMNTETERRQLKSTLPAEFYNAVIAVWGSGPTVPEPEAA